MKNNFKKVLLALLALATMGSLTACNLNMEELKLNVEELKDKIVGLLPGVSNESTGSEETSDESSEEVCEHEYADEYTCHDRDCTECGETLEATTAHVYADEYTCHDRDCTECGEKLEATTEHVFGDWVTIRYADCENGGLEMKTCECGKTEERDTDSLGHTYADEITCHDRTCTVEDCGYIKPASTSHEYGEWGVVTEATCLQNGEDKRTCSACGHEDTKATTKGHEFGEDGVCPMCGKSVKDLFITIASIESNTDKEMLTVDTISGMYEITTTGESDHDAYAMIPGAILTELKEMGHKQLTFTVINPATGLCDMADKCKSFMLAADAATNLWSPDTAVAYWGWKEFWDAGKKVSFTVDLETYAGRDLYIYTAQCATYPTIIQIAEFIDYTNPLTFVLSGQNSTVNYIEGKGWHFVATDATTGYYASISASVVQYYKSQGYNTMKVSYVNSFGLEGVTNVGNPVNSAAAILPEKVTGGNDWYYFNGFISQQATLDEATNSYYTYVNLESADHDFTKDIELYFNNTDVAGNTVGNQYISAIEFIKHTEHTYTWVVTEETNCVEVGYETGTCSVCKATTTRDLVEDLKDHVYEWVVTTPGDCENQGEETGTCKGCGDTQTRPTSNEIKAHYYDWVETTPGTCLVKAVETGTCTGCGDVQTRDGAYGDHTEGEWVEASQATCKEKATEQTNCTVCGELMTRETGELSAHTYSGIKCSLCGDSLVKNLIVDEQTSVITVNLAQGVWEINSTNGKDAYAKFDGKMLTTLKDSGYTKLTITVSTNEATAVKSCYIAADSRDNLWSADKAIAFYGWKEFWDNGKTFTFELDLATYAGRDIYIYTNNCQYWTKITINELIDYEHPEARLIGANNGSVEYIEGKGWHAYATDGANAFYVAIPAAVLQHYISNGYTSLKLSYVNNMGIGITTAGNPVNVQQAILLKDTAGNNDWNYCNGWLSAKCTNDGTGTYCWTIDLTDTNYDFTKDIQIYFTYTDVAGNATGHAYLTGMEFLK